MLSSNLKMLFLNTTIKLLLVMNCLFGGPLLAQSTCSNAESYSLLYEISDSPSEGIIREQLPKDEDDKLAQEAGIFSCKEIFQNALDKNHRSTGKKVARAATIAFIGIAPLSYFGIVLSACASSIFHDNSKAHIRFKKLLTTGISLIVEAEDYLVKKSRNEVINPNHFKNLKNLRTVYVEKQPKSKIEYISLAKAIVEGNKLGIFCLEEEDIAMDSKKHLKTIESKFNMPAYLKIIKGKYKHTVKYTVQGKEYQDFVKKDDHQKNTKNKELKDFYVQPFLPLLAEDRSLEIINSKIKNRRETLRKNVKYLKKAEVERLKNEEM